LMFVSLITFWLRAAMLLVAPNVVLSKSAIAVALRLRQRSVGRRVSAGSRNPRATHSHL
jgi:hypothetical protein